MPAELSLVNRIGAANHFLAVVSAARPDGSVHASLVNAGVLDDPERGTPSVACVVRGDARKLGHIRRSGRATVTFQAGWEWVSVEGPARIIGRDSDLDLAPLLRDVFRAAGGTHDNWDEFDRVMAAEGRVAVFVEAVRVLGVAR